MLPDFGPRAGIPRVRQRQAQRQRNLQPGAVPRQHDGLRLGKCRNLVKCPQSETQNTYAQRLIGIFPCVDCVTASHPWQIVAGMGQRVVVMPGGTCQ